MPGLLFDTDTPDLLLEPRFAGCRVATYADLVTPALYKQLHDRLVVIERGLGDPMHLATVADIEPGALTVQAGADLLHAWKQQGRPSVTAYHDRSLQAAVDQATAGLGISNWVATLDGTLLPDGRTRAVVQFAGAKDIGIHADLSIVWDDSWHPLPVAPNPNAVQAVQIEASQLASTLHALQIAISAL